MYIIFQVIKSRHSGKIYFTSQLVNNPNTSQAFKRCEERLKNKEILNCGVVKMKVITNDSWVTPDLGSFDSQWKEIQAEQLLIYNKLN